MPWHGAGRNRDSAGRTVPIGAALDAPMGGIPVGKPATKHFEPATSSDGHCGDYGRNIIDFTAPGSPEPIAVPVTWHQQM